MSLKLRSTVIFFISVLIVLTLVFIGCSQQEKAQNGKGVNTETNTNSATNVDKNTNTMLDQLIQYNVEIMDYTLDSETRREASNKFTSLLSEYLQTKNSFDESLPTQLNSIIEIKNSDKELLDYKLYWYSAPMELHGSLERNWVYIQWQTYGTIYSQKLIQESAEMPQDTLVLNDGLQPVLMITGYVTTENNNSAFISFWKKEDMTFKPYPITTKIPQNEFNLTVFDNTLLINPHEHIDISRVENGFEFSTSLKLKVGYLDGSIVIE